MIRDGRPGVLKDCRPRQQATNGQLDYLIAPQLPTHCACCNKPLPMFRDPMHSYCDGFMCIIKPARIARSNKPGEEFFQSLNTGDKL